MSDVNNTSGDAILQGFAERRQADAHIRAWQVAQWFWERFAADALEGAAPLQEWWADDQPW